MSYNSLTFKNRNFLRSCASSQTLRLLSLSDNVIGDTQGKLFFDDLELFQSKIKHLRLKNCVLRKNASSALIHLLGSGCMLLEELDISGNEMFHTADMFHGPFRRSFVKVLFVGGTGATAGPLIQLLNVIYGLKYIDINQTRIGTLLKLAPCLRGIIGMSICFSNILQTKDLIEIIQKSGTRIIWIINSLPQRVLDELLSSFKEIPKLTDIHIGTDIMADDNPPIPVIVENIQGSHFSSQR